MKRYLLTSLLFLSACTLPSGDVRKITAYGIWCMAPGACGVGYLHTERGPNLASEQSDKPSDALKNFLPTPLNK